MIVKNNYNECITNLACSIRKYFGLEAKHNSLEYIDKMLNEKQPENVVLILFDGMGSRILNRNLSKESFFNKNRVKEITTVFPATTTAATTSIATGLNPVEHGWLGWNMYIEPIDETITLFRNCEKGNEGIISDEFLKVKNKLVQKKIIDEINENTDFSSFEVSPYGAIPYDTLDEMFEIIKNKCQKTGKKYIYAYDTEPDHTMHDYGPDSKKARELIQTRNDKVEKLCSEIKNAMVIVIADHGHRLSEPIYLEKEYPQIMEMLERTTSIEQRAVSFKVKEEYKDIFKKEFNKRFRKDFVLYTKQEVLDSKLFGDGEENELFRDAIGDFIAIAENSSKSILTVGDKHHKSKHAGYSDDEVYIPLIVVNVSK